MPSYLTLPSNEFQGAACSNHPSAYFYSSLDIGISATSTGVAWANDAIGGAHMMQMQCAATSASATKIINTNNNNHINKDDSASHMQRQQDHIQRPPKQAKSQQLQIMTSFESGITPMYPQYTGNAPNATPSSPSSSSSLTAAHNTMQSSIVGPAQHYQWGPTSSPVESCSTSGSSTPSFASLSPSLSYSNSELGGASCDSSRPTSPSFNQSGYCEGYLSERRLRRFESESSNLIIRSRKFSTSSTSSSVSQSRMSALRESTICSSPSSPLPMAASFPTTPTTTIASTSTPPHQCPKCGQCFAGPAVLARHVESIHDKLLWNCVGCKSNLSRRDAVTRHINLSSMDSICRAVGTIGQIKILNGTEIHNEISSYRAKPLDEVMSRMGKKISTALRREIDLAKARGSEGLVAVSGTLSSTGDFAGCRFEEEGGLERLEEGEYEDEEGQMELEDQGEMYGEDGQKKRRRPSQPTLSRRKK
ncbi:hypothetical protein EDD21DRAFT_387538 [Dissophora ornata]|nr:hypothetical protein EDD21DRAFT_387538 [Dissophora ornata]